MVHAYYIYRTNRVAENHAEFAFLSHVLVACQYNNAFSMSLMSFSGCLETAATFLEGSSSWLLALNG